MAGDDLVCDSNLVVEEKEEEEEEEGKEGEEDEGKDSSVGWLEDII